MGVEYNCENCHLYFFLEATVWHSLAGCSQMRFCTSCLTLNAIAHPKGGNDTISCSPGPVFFDYINHDGESLSIGPEIKWEKKIAIQTSLEMKETNILAERFDAIDYDALLCRKCDGVGTLVGLGDCEINADGYSVCPGCKIVSLLLFRCYS